ncbi:hypothetical protein EGW08_007169 [Elysia chlorotica]|uniref:Uncharacterized protein n=1 Tax=Elysia chlorotica TaxID=188477 RepID=A0A433TU40_ELYCH|nr:hypothetical protein EGW08_007169 [Elysia chlorotica]
MVGHDSRVWIRLRLVYLSADGQCREEGMWGMAEIGLARAARLSSPSLSLSPKTLTATCHAGGHTLQAYKNSQLLNIYLPGLNPRDISEYCLLGARRELSTRHSKNLEVLLEKPSITRFIDQKDNKRSGRPLAGCETLTLPSVGVDRTGSGTTHGLARGGNTLAGGYGGRSKLQRYGGTFVSLSRYKKNIYVMDANVESILWDKEIVKYHTSELRCGGLSALLLTVFHPAKVHNVEGGEQLGFTIE